MIRGVLVGALALTALQAAVSSNQAAGRVGQLARATAGVVAAVLSPAVPAIPDLRDRAKTQQPTTAPAAEKAPAPAAQLAAYHRAPVPPVPGSVVV